MKRSFMTIIAVILTIQLATITVWAEDSSIFTVPQGIGPASEEELERWFATNNEVFELSNSGIEDVNPTNPKTSTWNVITPFVYYGQELSNSCGAAAVKMLLKALVGVEYSESSIRTGCQYSPTNGITIANSVAYINSVQTVHTYSTKYSIVQSWFVNNLYNSITNDCPAIISIIASSEDNWFYTTSGHALTLFGVLSDKSAFVIADPWGGYAGVSAWCEYTKSTSDIYTVYYWSHGYLH